MVNWFSSIFVFGNFAMTAITIKLLDRGLRPTLFTGSLLLLIGNWIRYAGSFSSSDGNVIVVCVAQALLGMSQSLVLSAPTRFSETWFTSSGRVAATAVMSLANPAGAAVAQVVVPFLVNDPGDIASMVLYVASVVSFSTFSHPDPHAKSDYPRRPLWQSQAYSYQARRLPRQRLLLAQVGLQSWNRCAY